MVPRSVDQNSCFTQVEVCCSSSESQTLPIKIEGEIVSRADFCCQAEMQNIDLLLKEQRVETDQLHAKDMHRLKLRVEQVISQYKL